MTARKSKPKQPSVIQNCHITVNSAANEYTSLAVQALAEAAKANAEAISRIAEGLKGSPAYGIYLTSE